MAFVGGYVVVAFVSMSLRFGSLLKPTIGFCGRENPSHHTCDGHQLQPFKPEHQGNYPQKLEHNFQQS